MNVELQNLMTPREYVDMVDKALAGLDPAVMIQDRALAAKVADIMETTKSLGALLDAHGIAKGDLAWPTPTTKLAKRFGEDEWPADLNAPEYAARAKASTAIAAPAPGAAPIAKAAVMLDDDGGAHIRSEKSLAAQAVVTKHLTAAVAELEGAEVCANAHVYSGYGEINFRA